MTTEREVPVNDSTSTSTPLSTSPPSSGPLSTFYLFPLTAHPFYKMDLGSEEMEIPQVSFAQPDEEAALSVESPSAEQVSLANRISNTKIYLLSETAFGKRKREAVEELNEEGDTETPTESDSVYRANAILLCGSPISHLDTERIFAYVVRHSESQPVGMEWVNDTTCVLVFSSRAAAAAAYGLLKRSTADDEDDDGFVVARSLPIDLWPPEDRINKSLGVGEGLKGALKMRWARFEDVKKKGSRRQSEFYRKQEERAVGNGINGGDAGKTNGANKTGRTAEDIEDERRRLDEDMDAFLANRDSEGGEKEPDRSSPPRSKMRSDHLNDRATGLSLLERTSVIRAHPDSSGDDHESRRRTDQHGRKRRKQNDGPRQARPRKTLQELDDELDAFLQNNN